MPNSNTLTELKGNITTNPYDPILESLVFAWFIEDQMANRNFQANLPNGVTPNEINVVKTRVENTIEAVCIEYYEKKSKEINWRSVGYDLLIGVVTSFLSPLVLAGIILGMKYWGHIDPLQPLINPIAPH